MVPLLFLLFAKIAINEFKLTRQKNLTVNSANTIFVVEYVKKE